MYAHKQMLLFYIKFLQYFTKSNFLLCKFILKKNYLITRWIKEYSQLDYPNKNKKINVEIVGCNFLRSK